MQFLPDQCQWKSCGSTRITTSLVEKEPDAALQGNLISVYARVGVTFNKLILTAVSNSSSVNPKRATVPISELSTTQRLSPTRYLE